VRGAAAELHGGAEAKERKIQEKEAKRCCKQGPPFSRRPAPEVLFGSDTRDITVRQRGR
jgi:hypothetical protein